MRFIVKVTFDVEAGNALVRKGTLGSTIQSILSEQKPEAAYFTALDGKRSGILIVNIDDVARIPAIAEPWFLALKAQVEFLATMTPEDLGRAGADIAAAAKKYG